MAVGYVCIKKCKYFARPHIHQTAFTLLVEKAEERLKQLDVHGLLIADENQEFEQRLIDDLDRYKQLGTDFGYKKIPIEKIIDSVHFVKSNNNYIVQLCDVLCFILNKSFIAHDELSSLFETAKKSSPALVFNTWLDDVEAPKGKVYFYKARYKLNAAKPWTFSKEFP